MGWVIMGKRELYRVEVLSQVDDSWLAVDNAAHLLAHTRRQVLRSPKLYRQDGASALRTAAQSWGQVQDENVSSKRSDMSSVAPPVLLQRQVRSPQNPDLRSNTV
ncbi:hypothetical protein SAMN05421759_12047 [Roseivivax lentus]|uniref:Transposase n=1 Tax=Roseivivax lentus TaxID=633194 RepID=A0A1N7PV79_9RHOB|nr:hypothetical protein SAMN05421759_12047 [Roseivivax lentus]